MEIYVVDSMNKRLRHRVVLADVVQCRSINGATVISILNKPNIVLQNSIDVVFQFYFRKATGFIRSDESHIVNTAHIITAEEFPMSDKIQLKLTGGEVATIRRGHEYAYFIINGTKKAKFVTENSDAKDAIIMSDIKNVKDIVSAIKKATGETVSSKYVVKRYNQLKIQL